MAWWDRFLEKRQQSSYTDTLVQYLISQVSGQAVSQPTATAAVESSAGAVARAFESAEAQGPMQLIESLTPGCLGFIGRELIRNGETVLYLAVEGAASGRGPGREHGQRLE